MDGFIGFFATVPDPRAENARHDLSELLFIALAATLCGAQSCADMAEFGQDKEEILRDLLRLPHGVPSHDTFSRVFRLLDSERFEAVFRRFTAAFAQAAGGLSGVVAVDGKALRGAFEAGAKSTPLHLVSAWAAEQRLVLGQRLAPGRGEVKAVLELVGLLQLQGCTITADALHGHRAMAAAVRAQGGDYALAVKGNRGPLFVAAQECAAAADPAMAFTAVETTHGRFEQRRATVAAVPPELARRLNVAGLMAVGRIDSLRRLGEREQSATRLFLLSRMLPAEQLLRIVRAHWGIENRLHWVLDVVFDEDRARSRKDHAAANLALLRRLALNILQADPYKASIRRKIKRAGWQNAYLFRLLAQMR
jgi:predicted transposase YbfD/YdcC